MAILKIKGNVKIGGIYECDFGLYKEIGTVTNVTKSAENADINNLNYRIPNELIKRRPVVVISKHRGLCLVVPISTTKEVHRKESKIPENQGIHVKLTENDFPANSYYYSNKVDMWAKCNLVTSIDSGRLRDLYSGKDSEGKKVFLDVFTIPEETLLKIRHGIIKSIGLQEILKKDLKENS